MNALALHGALWGRLCLLATLGVSGCAFPEFDAGGGDPVIVTLVTGNSPSSGGDGPSVFHDGIVVSGSGLDGGLAATLRGRDGAPVWGGLEIRSTLGTEAEIVLPAELEEGTYDLVLTRGSRSETVTVRLLRGPAGPDGAAALDGFVTDEALAAALPDPATLVSEGAAYETWVLASEAPDLTAYAAKTALDDLVPTADALGAYAHRDELLDPAGWPKKDELLATYAKTGDLPDLSGAILKADLPDTAPYVTKEAAAAAIATQADVEAQLYDKATMDAKFLAKDGTLGAAQVSQIQALVGEVLADAPCPSGTTPAGASCVSIHEASVRDKICDQGGLPLGVSGDDYPAGFPDSGSGVTKVLYACSFAGTLPSRHLTWFQAARACEASGLRLCTDDEWQRAMAGTSDAAAAGCVLSGAGPAVAKDDTECVSNYGAANGAGSLAEWTATWGQGGPAWVVQPGDFKAPWPLGYGDAQDTVSGWNGSARAAAPDTWTAGAPTAVVRGGSYGSGAAGGSFAIDMTRSPTESAPEVGFRCCRSR